MKETLQDGGAGRRLAPGVRALHTPSSRLVRVHAVSYDGTATVETADGERFDSPIEYLVEQPQLPFGEGEAFPA